ncbi:hypothetical protein [Duganella callida]|uniref:Uncharacterized protein n=1 Tax=Duganella callida TaxID=2561932 RepID=A0A4Y9SY54_9BURK|nr:hypothetical protein [Duganella callida]TFW31369.1 hypothetical protein E4L98_00290 [Duganella callida]
MANYPDIDGKTPRRSPESLSALKNRVVPYLQEIWLTDYKRRTPRHEIVAINLEGYSYLFDVAASHLIAAWTISNGPVAHERDRGRMRGHPLTAEPGYHRGHVIPHQLGGLCDINLVDQRGTLNIGDFRRLEKLAVATPGALYFTYWQYTSMRGDIPVAVDQGLLVPGQPADIVTHAN